MLPVGSMKAETPSDHLTTFAMERAPQLKLLVDVRLRPERCESVNDGRAFLLAA